MEIIGNISTTESPIQSTSSTAAVQNAGNTPQISAGPLSTRPAAGNAGSLFVSTDTLLIFRDSGTSWVTLSAASGTPGGTGGEVQFNNAGVVDGAANVRIDGDDLALSSQAAPSTPPANTVKVFNRQVAGRDMIAQIGPSGLDTALQPLLARNKVGFWCPPGNATTVPGVFGFTAYNSTGTVTTRSITTTNLFTRMRRLGYVSGNGTGSVCGARVTQAQITTGITFGAVPTGGFFKVIRFGSTDTVSTARQFVGISSSTGAPSNVEPSTLTNVIGVGCGTANSNLFLYFGGSSAQTPIDLGANFPANTASTDVYELALFCAPGVNNSVGWQVTRINTGDTVSGTLTAATAGVQLPANTTLLTYAQSWRSNNTTASAVGLDIFSDYIETDQ